MSAVLDALRNLDLDYQQDQRVNAAGQAGRIADITEVVNLPQSRVICQAYLLLACAEQTAVPVIPHGKLAVVARLEQAAHSSFSANCLCMRVHDRSHICMLSLSGQWKDSFVEQ